MSHSEFLALLVLLPVSLIHAQKPITGSVSGQALASDGRGIRAWVVLDPSAPVSTSAKPLAALRAISDGRGVFEFAQVPPGAYSICAAPIGGQAKDATESLVDTCEWRLLTGPMNVAAGQELTGVLLSVPQGALLRVRVNDPTGVLAAAAPQGKSALLGLDPNLQVFLKSGNGLMHPVLLTSQSAAGREHTSVVPYGLALSLSVSGPGFNLSDASGKALASSIPVPVAAGATGTEVDLTVAGRRP